MPKKFLGAEDKNSENSTTRKREVEVLRKKASLATEYKRFQFYAPKGKSGVTFPYDSAAETYVPSCQNEV